jgi:hypothetical protein
MYQSIYLHLASVASHTCATPILLSKAKYHNKFVASRSQHRDAAPILLSKANRNEFTPSQLHDGESSSFTIVHRKNIVEIFMTLQPSLISVTVRQLAEMRA